MLGHCPSFHRPVSMLLLVHFWKLDVLVFELAFKRLDKRVLKNIHDRCHDLGRRLVKASGERDPRAETIFRVIANDSRQPADNSLPDEIDRVLSVMRGIEDRDLESGRCFTTRASSPSSMSSVIT